MISDFGFRISDLPPPRGIRKRVHCRGGIYAAYSTDSSTQPAASLGMTPSSSCLPRNQNEVLQSVIPTEEGKRPSGGVQEGNSEVRPPLPGSPILQIRGRVDGNSKFKIENSKLKWGWTGGIPNSSFLIPNSHRAAAQ